MWIKKQEQYLFNIEYFHVVFTIPSELNTVMLQNQRIMYSLFFKAVSETLLELGGNPKHLGAKPGFTLLLHTWGQNLLYHPHIHCIISGGGLTGDKKWRNSRKKFFIPVKVLSKLFRGKFLASLTKTHAALEFHGSAVDLMEPEKFGALIAAMYRIGWVTYCKPPFENASKVVKYLGRYTHRVAISNNRILSLDDGNVTFSWRDYRDGNKNKAMTVTAVEFIRRFMLHVLPSGFCKIRHYGILASRNKSERVMLCKLLTDTIITYVAKSDNLELLKEIFGNEFNLCPNCRVGYLTRASPR
jgi:hypothetical protein